MHNKVPTTSPDDSSCLCSIFSVSQSRSHCAIMLTLLTLDAKTRAFRQTQFSIVDLAGAERPEKALGERISKEKAMQV